MDHRANVRARELAQLVSSTGCMEEYDVQYVRMK